MSEVTPPRVEGTVRVGPRRRLGFAEFGPPTGRGVVWLHGTPGARRQIPAEAREMAHDVGVRIIGIDRPGIGSSTPHRYASILDFTDDLASVADSLGIDHFGVIGLSGGGPYALAAGAALADRVPVIGVLGGVAPTVGPDGIGGGLVGLGSRLRPLIAVGHTPMGVALTAAVRMIRPLASPGLDLYARLSPEGDRRLLARPEFKAMFLDDLLNGSRRQLSAPLADVLLFTRDWGFRLADVGVPVVWWHGDADHIVPLAHGTHTVGRLPEGELRLMAGESHLGGLGLAEDVLTTLLARWDEGTAAGPRSRRSRTSRGR